MRLECEYSSGILLVECGEDFCYTAITLTCRYDGTVFCQRILDVQIACVGFELGEDLGGFLTALYVVRRVGTCFSSFSVRSAVLP